ncbi:MAG TPA: lysophospholipid acyltransferase family protein [Anaeromyxobacteraceae bacterium]|nr:lysophospholipid acyltransferase family protein [Anaeromyxobacteraceae bacterium]
MRILVPVTATLAYAVSFIALLIWPPLTLLIFLVTWPFDHNHVVTGRFYRILPAIWSRSFPFWRIRIEGKWPPRRRAYVIAPNHQSFLDIFVLCNIHHEWKWVAKKQLFKIPLFGWGLSLTGAISLDRGDLASAVKVMEKSRHYIEQGISVLIFPEGTRSEDGKLLPFKPGAFKLAIETGAPVLPIAITGTAHGMPKGGPWVRPTQITVRILEPVSVTGLTGRDVRRLRESVRSRIAHALGQEHSAAELPKRTPSLTRMGSTKDAV